MAKVMECCSKTSLLGTRKMVKKVKTVKMVKTIPMITLK